jgi:glucose-6-phosphate dehydrogenase assembly protein OpcA
VPTTYKVLGQVNPAATTATTAYTVPSATQTIVSSIVVANLAGTAGAFRISVRPTGESQANKHYLAYDATVAGTDSLTLTLGITLGATDVVTVYASSASMSFSLFGSEIS